MDTAYLYNLYEMLMIWFKEYLFFIIQHLRNNFLYAWVILIRLKDKPV